MSKPRVLLIAESANPEGVSGALISWSHARALAEVADVHMVTEARSRAVLERAGWRDGRDFTAIRSSVVDPLYQLGLVFRGGVGKGWEDRTAKGWTTHTAFYALSYYHFERLVWQRFGADIEARRYDVVHRLMPLSPTIPSTLAARCKRAGVPFIWGPINGGVQWPKGFSDARWREREWLSYLRPAHKLMPYYGSSRRDAAALLVGSKVAWAEMPARYRDKCIYLPENAVEPDRFSLFVDGPVTLPLRVAYVGRLVALKGVDMLLEAAAPLVHDGKVFIDVIGDGPEMPNLRALVARRRIGDGVKLDGWTAHTRLQERLIQSDVFAYPSIRDFGGGAVIEAMALGLVPVVVDYAGPSELVTEGTGYKVPIGPREEVIRGFREVLLRLASDPASIRRMGRAARDRALGLFTWPARARQTAEVYEWVLGRREKPDFGMPLRDLEGSPPALQAVSRHHSTQASSGGLGPDQSTGK